MPSRGERLEKGAPPLVAIVGPTGVGKTRLAVALGRELGGEIVSADSRQIYRCMDIGTDKPTPQQRKLVPHHLIDVTTPDQGLTLAQYQESAYRAIEDISSRQRLPFLVGGSGLYVRAVLEGFLIPRVKPNLRLRRRLLQEAQRKGVDILHSRLREVDPEAATNIDPSNVRRVIRALEVYHALKQPISQLQKRRSLRYRALKIGLTMEREELYRRVNQRVDRMIERGLLGEVQSLVAEGYGYELPAMSALGYRQMGTYLRGEVDLPTAVRKIKSETRRFVRQQYKWFRLDDETIRWFDMRDSPYAHVRACILDFLTAAG